MVEAPKSTAEEDPALGVSDRYTDQLFDPAAVHQRQDFVHAYRHSLETGEIRNGIRPLALMARECMRRGIPILNLTIGDIDWRNFSGLEGAAVADAVGLDPRGEAYRSIEELRRQLTLERTDPERDSLWSYQPESTGLLELRERFASFIRGFGMPYTADQTILSPGSLNGIDNILGTLRFSSARQGIGMDLLFPVPGFTVIEAQAIRRLIDVTRIRTEPETGYAVSAGDLERMLGGQNDRMSILYLTPMNNPTSTVYDLAAFDSALSVFRDLRPNGYVLLDLAYIEMVDRDKSEGIIRRVRESGHMDRIISTVSMSKLFGYPRLRMAAAFSTDPFLYREFQAQWQTTLASNSGPAELDALARWEVVNEDSRRAMYRLFRSRQDGLITLFRRVNESMGMENAEPLIDMGSVHREVPLYVYTGLSGGDSLDLFIRSGILGVPGQVFGDDGDQPAARFSMGIESFSGG